MVTATRPAFAVIANDDDGKVIGQIRLHSPNTIIMLRRAGPKAWDIIDNPSAQTGAQRAYLLLPGWKPLGADYYNLVNEWTSDDDPVALAAAVEAERATMAVANQLHVKLGVGGFSTGQPKLEDPAVYAACQPLFEQAQNDGHAVVIHVYNPAHFARWVRVMQDYPRLTILVGEYSTEQGTPAGLALQNLIDVGALLFGRWPQIPGAALYEVRPVASTNFEINQSDYRRYAR